MPTMTANPVNQAVMSMVRSRVCAGPESSSGANMNGLGAVSPFDVVSPPNANVRPLGSSPSVSSVLADARARNAVAAAKAAQPAVKAAVGAGPLPAGVAVQCKLSPEAVAAIKKFLFTMRPGGSATFDANIAGDTIVRIIRYFHPDMQGLGGLGSWLSDLVKGKTDIGTVIGKVAGAVGSAVSSANPSSIAKAVSGPVPPVTLPAPVAVAPKKNYTPFVIAGVGVFALLGVLAMVLRK